MEFLKKSKIRAKLIPSFIQYMRHKYCKGREKIIINYTSNDCLLRRESTRINQRIEKNYQTQKSIAWSHKEQTSYKT